MKSYILAIIASVALVGCGSGSSDMDDSQSIDLKENLISIHVQSDIDDSQKDQSNKTEGIDTPYITLIPTTNTQQEPKKREVDLVEQIVNDTIINESRGSESLIDYTYTYAKQGVLALSTSQDKKQNLYLFGLSAGIPKYERRFVGIGKTPTKATLKPLPHGQVEIAYENKRNRVIYDYIHGSVVSK